MMFRYSSTQVVQLPRWKKWTMLLAVVAVLICSGVNAFISSTTVDYGTKIRVMQKEQTSLVRRNKELGGQLAQVSSLSELQQRAQAQGFIPVKNATYVGVQTPVAQR